MRSRTRTRADPKGRKVYDDRDDGLRRRKDSGLGFDDAENGSSKGLSPRERI